MKKNRRKNNTANRKLQRLMRRLILIACVFIVFLMGCFVASAIRDVHGEQGTNTVEVNIPAGTPTKRIAEILSNRGIIRHPQVFLFYARSHGYSTKFMAGIHTMRRHMDYEGICMELMQVGRDWDVFKLTVIEGMTIKQIAEKLEDYHVMTADEFIRAAEAYVPTYDYIPQGEGRAYRLEGYLFPATYSLKRTQTATEIIDAMLARFDQSITEDVRTRAAGWGYTIDQIITLASVIQMEAADVSEMPLVSSVFHNRLRIGQHMESCATVQYVLPERKPVLSVADTKIESLYNTYMHPGLPVGPIGAPGDDAIHAAIYPEETNYFYFVLGKDGKSIFSETYEQHLAAQN